MGYIALATATSGVAISIPPGGCTAHSRFKIPIDLDDNTNCNISKESSLVGLIQDAKLIVRDEVSMAKKRMLEVLNLFLKDLMDTKTLFGGKFVVLGDSRVILTTKNDFVDEINDMIIHRFSGKSKTFIGTDEALEFNNQTQFEDLLHTLNPTSLPPYMLHLKENCPIILLRNLNPSEGLCNGTRLACCDFRTHVISAKITTGDIKNTHEPVFSHGQLYVALSRAKSSSCVRLLIRPPTPTSHDDYSTS
ncbi:hypothetical protein H5410_026654 [Solanum commersonii]|uniref:ATP-dependent DNA helicase n=1 Tax=Solanum commersonii TaxID=4109 RepID=A0A9J5YXM6_SOLCO|nr:hypothetical protein H5410_026654 [Solanum commersonii]